MAEGLPVGSFSLSREQRCIVEHLFEQFVDPCLTLRRLTPAIRRAELCSPSDLVLVQQLLRLYEASGTL